MLEPHRKCSCTVSGSRRCCRPAAKPNESPSTKRTNSNTKPNQCSMPWYANATAPCIDTKLYDIVTAATATTTTTTIGAISTTINCSHSAIPEATIAKNSDGTPIRAEQTQSIPWYDANPHTANVTEDRCWRFVCLATMVNKRIWSPKNNIRITKSLRAKTQLAAYQMIYVELNELWKNEKIPVSVRTRACACVCDAVLIIILIVINTRDIHINRRKSKIKFKTRTDTTVSNRRSGRRRRRRKTNEINQREKGDTNKWRNVVEEAEWLLVLLSFLFFINLYIYRSFCSFTKQSWCLPNTNFIGFEIINFQIIIKFPFYE